MSIFFVKINTVLRAGYAVNKSKQTRPQTCQQWAVSKQVRQHYWLFWIP